MDDAISLHNPLIMLDLIQNMNVYDFDGTIFDGEASRMFCFYSMLKRPYIIIFWPVQGVGWGLHKLRLINMEKMKSMFFYYFRTVDVDKLTRQFWKKYEKRIKPWYEKYHMDDDLIITASPRFLIEPICEKIGVKNLIATEVDRKTGKLRSKNCRGEEKIRRFKEIYKEEKIDKFFFDSHHDISVAKFADEAFIIRGNEVEKWTDKNP